MSAPTRYPVPAGTHRVEDIVQRSRFVTTVARASTPEEAHAFVALLKEEFPDATHHCWAFVAGPPGSTARIGMSDAGEPHGTAGRPMLATLLHGGVGEIVAVVTRYFGGVKLGTGGLGRAYAGGVKHALETLGTVEQVDRVPVLVTLGYAEVEPLRRALEALDVVVEHEAYGEEVLYRCAVPEEAVAALREAVADLTRGAGRVEDISPAADGRG